MKSLGKNNLKVQNVVKLKFRVGILCIFLAFEEILWETGCLTELLKDTHFSFNVFQMPSFLGRGAHLKNRQYCMVVEMQGGAQSLGVP